MHANLAHGFADDNGRDSYTYHHAVNVACYASPLQNLEEPDSNSPSMWANIVDLRIIFRGSDGWREVFKGSGNSPLANIRAMSPAGNEAMGQFFLSLLNDD